MAQNPLKLKPEDIGQAIPEILRIGQAHFVGQVLYSVVKMGVPDAIGADVLTAAEIAAKLSGPANAEMLDRSLRFLGAATGLVVETASPDGKMAFKLSPTAALLQTGVPEQPSMACGVLHWMEKPSWDAWGKMHGKLTGEIKNPYLAVNGKEVFDYYAANPESGVPFNNFMSFMSAGELPPVAGAYDWSAFDGKTVLDLGGSLGDVMKTVKAKQPGIRAINFDRADVIAEAVKVAQDGVENVSGDFFDASTLPKVDGAIVMKHILHDWTDERSIEILKSCHAALEPGGKVIVIDAVLPPPGESSELKVMQAHMDMLMAMFQEGKERTLAQWEALAKAAGFKVEGVTPTPMPITQFVTLALA